MVLNDIKYYKQKIGIYIFRKHVISNTILVVLKLALIEILSDGLYGYIFYICLLTIFLDSKNIIIYFI